MKSKLQPNWADSF